MLTPLPTLVLSINLTDVLERCLQLNSPAVKSYDVVAVEAVSARAFQFACEQADIDVITFDVTNRIPFLIKRPWVGPLHFAFWIRYERRMFKPKAMCSP